MNGGAGFGLSLLKGEEGNPCVPNPSVFVSQDDEVAILNFMSQREGRSKTDIIREPLEPIFKTFCEDPEGITLRGEAY